MLVVIPPARLRPFRAVLFSGQHLDIVLCVSPSARMWKDVVEFMHAFPEGFAFILFKFRNGLSFHAGRNVP